MNAIKFIVCWETLNQWNETPNQISITNSLKAIIAFKPLVFALNLFLGVTHCTRFRIFASIVSQCQVMWEQYSIQKLWLDGNWRTALTPLTSFTSLWVNAWLEKIQINGMSYRRLTVDLMSRSVHYKRGNEWHFLWVLSNHMLLRTKTICWLITARLNPYLSNT